MQMRSAHSRVSLADIVSRPVAFDLFSLFKSEKNFANSGRMELKTLVCAGDVPLINITIWRINITAKFWTDDDSFESSVGLVIDTPLPVFSQIYVK